MDQKSARPEPGAGVGGPPRAVLVGSDGMTGAEARTLGHRFGLPLAGEVEAAPDRAPRLERDAIGRLVLTEGPGCTALALDLPRSARPDDPLLRALGVGRGVTTIVDATAGLGREGLRLASIEGVSVVLIEREGWLAALLDDLVERSAAAGNPLGARVVHAEAADWLAARTADRPDAVYLDPMFDPGRRHRSALPKKDLQLLRSLCAPPGPDEADRLLTLARRVATRRVVWKRPLKAPRGTGPAAQGRVGEVRGRLARFDIYAPKTDATNPEHS